MKILVIEDDADTADYAVQGLREDGHAVDLESNGKAGLVRAIGGQYDVLIIDRRLPEVSHSLGSR